MIDHIHSLIQADSVKALSEFISRTTSVFVRVYDKERKRSGSLFEERFGSAPKANNPVIDMLYRGMESLEKKILTDFIITRYNVIDYERVMRHFNSYDQLLTAIHSTTGSECDLNEDKDRLTDGVYRDFIRILKQMGIGNIRNVMMLDDNMKPNIARNLLRAQNSHLRQVYKFLNMVPPLLCEVPE